MAVGIGAAVAITAFSACIAPWLDRQDNQNGDDQESRATPENPSKTVCQLQPDSLKSLFLNGLRKLSSVCLPSVDMTGSLQYFVSKPFVDIDINIISQSTQTDADSTYFTAIEETKSTCKSDAFGESEKSLQIVPSSSSSGFPADASLHNQKVMSKIQKPPRAHPPRKLTDSARDVQAASTFPNKIIQETSVAKEIQQNSEIKESTPIHYQLKKDALINKDDLDDPSSTMKSSERLKTFEVVVTVHKDASTVADSIKNQKEHSRVSFAPDHNNNSSIHDNYKNNLNYVSSMGQSFDDSVDSSNIRGSSSKDESHEHHSSSLVTRIRIVLSRYFNFGKKSKSFDASGRLKGMCSRVQTESSGCSNKTGDTIINYPGKMSSCIVQDLNSENERSRLSFSIAEVTSSTRIADEAGAFDPVRDPSEYSVEPMIDSKRVQNMRRFGFDSNRDKSGKFRGILSDENFRNSRTTISDSETEYPTFETKRGILKKLRRFFQRDKSKKMSFLQESKCCETCDGKLKENYYGQSVLCTEL